MLEGEAGHWLEEIVRRAAFQTFEEVRVRFAAGEILRASPRELEQALATLASESFEDAARRAQAREMSATLRALLQNRHQRQSSNLALLAVCLALAALLLSGAQAYRSWVAYANAHEPDRELGDFVKAMRNSGAGIFADTRTETTVAELAARAPSLRHGTVQAWWAGEQARQVQELEREAKRQTLAGDRDGAALSASRADQIRNGISSLTAFERVPPR